MLKAEEMQIGDVYVTNTSIAHYMVIYKDKYQIKFYTLERGLTTLSLDLINNTHFLNRLTLVSRLNEQ
jgi:hypothetical protein